jgi:hypothetical protein
MMDIDIEKLAALFAEDEGVEVLATERGVVVRRVFPGGFTESATAAEQWGARARFLVEKFYWLRLDGRPGVVGRGGDETVIEMHFANPTIEVTVAGSIVEPAQPDEVAPPSVVRAT